MGTFALTRQSILFEPRGIFGEMVPFQVMSGYQPRWVVSKSKQAATVSTSPAVRYDGV